MLAFDLHLDLAMNALWYDRDLLLDLESARASEAPRDFTALTARLPALDMT